jgi:hypothetical protein
MEIGIIIGIVILILILAFTFGGETNASKNANLRASNNKIIHQLIAPLTNEEKEAIWNSINKLRDGEEITSADFHDWMEFERRLNPKIPKNSELEWLLTMLSSDMMVFGSYNYNPEKDINTYLTIETSKKRVEAYKLNLAMNEICYLSGGINYFEEKTISRQVTYGGISTKSGSFRMGSVNYTVTPNKGMVLIDLGTYFVTDKRILFIGNKDRTIRQIKLTDIISYEVFKDSILLHTLNNKKPMLLQMEYDFSKKNAQGETYYSFRYDNILIGFLLRKLLVNV